MKYLVSGAIITISLVQYCTLIVGNKSHNLLPNIHSLILSKGEKDVFGKYPMSNACGQGRYSGISMASYQDLNRCAEEEAFMACPIDPATVARASTKGIFDGSPPPLECYPRTPAEMFTGAWDPSLFNTGTQTMGKIDPSSIPSANSVSDDQFFIEDIA